MKPRHVDHHHGLDAAVQQPLIAGQAGEAAGFVDAQLLTGLLGLVVEVVGDGMNHVAAVLLKQIGQPRPASAAADQPQLDLAGELLGLRLRRGGLGRHDRCRGRQRLRRSGRQAPPENSRRENGRGWLMM